MSKSGDEIIKGAEEALEYVKGDESKGKKSKLFELEPCPLPLCRGEAKLSFEEILKPLGKMWEVHDTYTIECTSCGLSISLTGGGSPAEVLELWNTREGGKVDEIHKDSNKDEEASDRANVGGGGSGSSG